jgi:hypothetical protein
MFILHLNIGKLQTLNGLCGRDGCPVTHARIEGHFVLEEERGELSSGDFQ